MKSMKKLIPAICMLLIAASLLGSSTYAWFSMNSTVTATGMQVNAVASKNLVISTNNTIGADEASTKASTFSTLQSLSPASVSTLAGSQNFFKASNATGVDYNTGKGNVGTVFATATPITAVQDTTADVVKHTFYIRAVGADGTKFGKLYVSDIKVLAGAADANGGISAALRVGVVCGDRGFIYAPVSGATAEYKAIKAAGAVATVTDGIYKTAEGADLNVPTTALTTYTNSSALVDEVTTEYVTVDIYIWYEGEDAACTSQNSINVQDVNVSVSFRADEPTA